MCSSFSPCPRRIASPSTVWTVCFTMRPTRTGLQTFLTCSGSGAPPGGTHTFGARRATSVFRWRGWLATRLACVGRWRGFGSQILRFASAMSSYGGPLLRQCGGPNFWPTMSGTLRKVVWSTFSRRVLHVVNPQAVIAMELVSIAAGLYAVNAALVSTMWGHAARVPAGPAIRLFS